MLKSRTTGGDALQLLEEVAVHSTERACLRVNMQTFIVSLSPILECWQMMKKKKKMPPTSHKQLEVMQSLRLQALPVIPVVAGEGLHGL